MSDDRGRAESLNIINALRRGTVPASGLARKPRGVSPQASVVMSPTASRRSQIWGMSSTRIQWYWMFWRSEMSAVPRANCSERSASTRTWVGLRARPSVRTRSMKYSSESSCGSSWAVRPPSMPGRRWV